MREGTRLGKTSSAFAAFHDIEELTKGRSVEYFPYGNAKKYRIQHNLNAGLP